MWRVKRDLPPFITIAWVRTTPRMLTDRAKAVASYREFSSAAVEKRRKRIPGLSDMWLRTMIAFGRAIQHPLLFTETVGLKNSLRVLLTVRAAGMEVLMGQKERWNSLILMIWIRIKRAVIPKRSGTFKECSLMPRLIAHRARTATRNSLCFSGRPSLRHSLRISMTSTYNLESEIVAPAPARMKCLAASLRMASSLGSLSCWSFRFSAPSSFASLRLEIASIMCRPSQTFLGWAPSPALRLSHL